MTRIANVSKALLAAVVSLSAGPGTVPFFADAQQPQPPPSSDAWRATLSGDCPSKTFTLRVRLPAKLAGLSVPFYVEERLTGALVTSKYVTLDSTGQGVTTFPFPGYQEVDHALPVYMTPTVYDPSMEVSCYILPFNLDEDTIIEVPCSYSGMAPCKSSEAITSDSGQVEDHSRALEAAAKEVDPFYQVSVRSSSRCVSKGKGKIRGRFVVRVKDSTGRAVRNAHVSVLLVDTSDSSQRSYSQGGKTNRFGRATLGVDIDARDQGKAMWCSVALDNPALPADQQVPCTFMAAECEENEH